MLTNYWPDAAAVNACIKNEAETADVAVLLAVHQPSPLVQRHAGTNIDTPATEKDLLDAFLTDNVPGGALVLPITGPSGVGKSHLIRWLDAQLRRSEKRERLHIIRIPKSASLRTVVELILEPLAEDPRYAKPSADLANAVAEVNQKDAVVTFRAHLENALHARYERMLAEFREHPSRSHLKFLIGHAQRLPRLFSDAVVEEHFAKNVFARIVARALGVRREQDVQDDALSQFEDGDLLIPESVDLDLAARPVRDYYQTQIAVAPKEKLQPVIQMLNDAVDSAIANLFKLEQSAGGMTLQDIILAVRAILLEEDKELVLLIEDFQALAGIQDVLLKVCIQEGEYDGKKLRATMRTAIALTDGYLIFRDTILTRAQREWVVGANEDGDEKIKAGVVEMVGAYLNAARWGAAELSRLFHRSEPAQPLGEWLPIWRDDAASEEGSDIVSAFGGDSKGAPLFPFNRQAIEALAERHLSQGGRLVFNPRRVINEILRHTLFLRPAFEARNFPPSDFQRLTSSAAVAGWIRQTRCPEPIGRRLSALLAVWGGNPSTVEGIAQVHPTIFTAFGLPTPSELANLKYAAPEPTRPLTPTPDAQSPEVEPRPSPEESVQDSEIEGWRTRLEEWSSGIQMSQKDASTIRSNLMAMAKDAINMPALRIRDADLQPTWIEIPNARGNNQTRRRLTFCSNHTDEDGAVRAGLLGVIRHYKRKTWNYPGGDEDYVACAVLVDRLVKQLVPMLIEDAKSEGAVLAATLATQARIAGNSPPIRLSSADAVLTAAFAPAGLKEMAVFEESWERLRTSALGVIREDLARPTLQRELLRRAAAYQGTGNKPFAVDVTRLLDALAKPENDPEAGDRLPPEIKNFTRQLTDARVWTQVARIVSKLREFRQSVEELVDVSFDKAQFVENLQAVIRLLSSTATFPHIAQFNVREFERKVVEFQASPIVDLVTKSGIIVDEADRENVPKILNALGSLDLGLIDRTMSFLTTTAALLDAAEVSVAREEIDRSQADPSSLADEIEAILTKIGGESMLAEVEI